MFLFASYYFFSLDFENSCYAQNKYVTWLEIVSLHSVKNKRSWQINTTHSQKNSILPVFRHFVANKTSSLC